MARHEHVLFCGERGRYPLRRYRGMGVSWGSSCHVVVVVVAPERRSRSRRCRRSSRIDPRELALSRELRSAVDILYFLRAFVVFREGVLLRPRYRPVSSHALPSSWRPPETERRLVFITHKYTTRLNCLVWPLLVVELI